MGSQTTTRERLLEAAITLMRQSGLSGAGINEIVRASGAPKGSVYYFFPGGKEQIVSEALALHTGRVMAFMEQALAAPKTAPRKVKALFDAYAERLEESHYGMSCPSGTVCLDIDAEMETLRLRVAANFEQYIATIARHLRVGSDRDNEAFAAFVLTAIQGAYIRGRADRSGKPFREAGAWLAALAGHK